MLQLAVFDLDYTVWKPEMYQLYGPPSLIPIESLKKKKRPSAAVLKEARTIEENMIVTDTSGTPMTVFDGASHALSEINKMKRDDHPIQAAIASRTDEPAWARKCMGWLTAADGTPLSSCFDHVEISYADKRRHFESLHRKTGIPYEQMCFFDNEHGNIRSVSKLGVKCLYTPDGMTREAWREALGMFDM